MRWLFPKLNRAYAMLVGTITLGEAVPFGVTFREFYNLRL